MVGWGGMQDLSRKGKPTFGTKLRPCWGTYSSPSTRSSHWPVTAVQTEKGLGIATAASDSSKTERSRKWRGGESFSATAPTHELVLGTSSEFPKRFRATLGPLERRNNPRGLPSIRGGGEGSPA
jgi:hypothetical protein